MNESKVVQTHLPCDACGSSDALALYDDGHSYCFSCENTVSGQRQKKKSAGHKDLISFDDLALEPLTRRGITQETCRKYGYYISNQYNQFVQVACYFNDNSELEGQKIRTKTKEFVTRGKVSDKFFGQHLFLGGGKKLVVTEGEIDCLTVSQVQGNKYPVVSLPCGASSAKKTFKAQIEWLDLFDEVIVMFDMDEQGRKAVQSVEGILKPGKLRIASLPLKDPNECLLNGRADEIVKAVWNAKVYKPDGIMNGADLLDELTDEKNEAENHTLPWNIELNQMMMGLRQGELVVITAGTGVGKTTFIRQIAYDLGVVKKLKVGLMMLEENPKRTAKGIMSIHVGKRLHIDRNAVTSQEFTDAFQATLGTGRFIFYEHFGSTEGENLLNKMRYMATGENCDFIILDHVSIAISGLEGDNERRMIDRLMTQMRSLVEETNVGLLVISHLRRSENSQKAHEEGGATSLSQLRGSHSISQLSDSVIGLERNQQDDGKSKNLVKLRLLKCRFTGETGVAGYLWYNKETDRLEAVDNLSEYTESETVDLGNGQDSDF